MTEERDPQLEIRRKVLERAAALEDIQGTEGFRTIIEILRSLEVGIMRDAFLAREKREERWEYYAGLRDGVVNILDALQGTIREGALLREQEAEVEEEERLTAGDLGLSFGQGDLS